ncbi:MAG: AAA-like domain-containing protein [Cyanobacteria bacterium P01_F01_bin.86]
MNKPVVFTTNATVQSEDGTYLTRQADETLLQLCRKGEYAYILTARQMGKSSLMVATAERLQTEGIQTVIVDLQRLGAQTTTAEQWYLGVLTRLARLLGIVPELMTWWQANQHYSQVERMVQFLEDVVLPRTKGSLVVFFDEIDSTLSLDFTDDFFIALRYCYTARAENPAFNRLSFVLIGVATPSELITDRNRTPFNIGTLVELTDFTETEAMPLAAGLGLPESQAQQVLCWVLQWTGGHPYLTQRVCVEIVQQARMDWTEKAVTDLIEQLFFGEKREQDRNLQFVQSMLMGRAPEADVLGVLRTYREIRGQRKVVYDEDQSLLKAHLKLSGVVKRVGQILSVRNSIYREVFDWRWTREYWPETWWARLKPAMPLITGLTMGIAVLGFLSIYALQQTEKARNQTQVALGRQLAAQAGWVRQQRSDLLPQSILLAVEAMRLLQPYRVSTADASQILHDLNLLMPEQARFVHEVGVRDIALSPNGRFLATDSGETIQKESIVRVWDIKADQEVAQLTHEDDVRDIAFSPDERFLATGRRHGTVRVWEFDTKQEFIRFAHQGDVEAVNFSLNGRFLATGSKDKTARIWDIEVNQEIARFVHSGWVHSVSFSPDGRYLATGSGDNTARIWDIKANQEVARFVHSGRVLSVSFSPDGRHLAIGGEDTIARVWDIEVNQEIARFVHSGWVYSVSFSPDGRYLATGSRDNTARIWDIKASQEIARIVHHGIVYEASFGPDGQYLATGSGDKTARIWDFEANQTIARIVHHGRIDDVVSSPDSRYLATGIENNAISIEDNTVWIWDIEANQEVARFIPPSGNIHNLNLSPDGRYVAASVIYTDPELGVIDSLLLWDTETNQQVNHLKGQVDSVGFSPNGQYLAIGISYNYEHTQVWDIKANQEASNPNSTDVIGSYAVDFSPDSRYLATGHMGNPWTFDTVQVWDIKANQEVIQFNHISQRGLNRADFESIFAANETVVALDFSPNSRYLAIGSTNTVAKVWDIEADQEVAYINHESGVTDLDFGPDGRYLATGSWDTTSKVWDIETNQEVASFTHEGSVIAVDFSPDGQYLATGGQDGTARVWNIETKEEVTRFAYEKPVRDVYFSADGRSLIIRSSNLAEVRQIYPDDLIELACSRLNRNLTYQEWQRFIGDEPYQKTCDNLPYPNDYEPASDVLGFANWLGTHINTLLSMRL